MSLRGKVIDAFDDIKKAQIYANLVSVVYTLSRSRSLLIPDSRLVFSAHDSKLETASSSSEWICHAATFSWRGSITRASPKCAGSPWQRGARPCSICYMVALRSCSICYMPRARHFGGPRAPRIFLIGGLTWRVYAGRMSMYPTAKAYP